jgi:hypothetical protein
MVSLSMNDYFSLVLLSWSYLFLFSKITTLIGHPSWSFSDGSPPETAGMTEKKMDPRLLLAGMTEGEIDPR